MFVCLFVGRLHENQIRVRVIFFNVINFNICFVNFNFKYWMSKGQMELVLYEYKEKTNNNQPTV